MAGAQLRIGIVGCGHAARIHLDRLLALEGVLVVGCADSDRSAAESLASHASASGAEAAAFTDHKELLRRTTPEALAIFTPHIAHYRPTMDALQAGCHVFIEKPLSTNVQEAVDIVNLARGRGLKVGVGHQYRLSPSLAEARRRLAAGTIGPTRLVTATLALSWLESHAGAENSWRFDPKVTEGETWPTPATIRWKPSSGPPARRPSRPRPYRTDWSRGSTSSPPRPCGSRMELRPPWRSRESPRVPSSS